MEKAKTEIKKILENKGKDQTTQLKQSKATSPKESGEDKPIENLL
jgi:hypothetical protein